METLYPDLPSPWQCPACRGQIAWGTATCGASFVLSPVEMGAIKSSGFHLTGSCLAAIRTKADRNGDREAKEEATELVCPSNHGASASCWWSPESILLKISLQYASVQRIYC